MVELGAGGVVPTSHLPDGKVDSILGGKASDFGRTIREYGLEISALSTHDNHLHPNLEARERINNHLKKVIEAAGQLDAPVVNTFFGCPVDWGTWYPFPPENVVAFDKAWQEAKETWMPILDFASDHDVKIGIEVEASSLVYNNQTTKRMFDEIPHKSLGLNYDPSHLVWQLIDITVPIYKFGEKIVHCHAKDTEMIKHRIDESGVLITGSWRRQGRGWRYRVPGWGEVNWNKVISTLAEVGYDFVISVEHEDPVMSAEDGAEKAIQFLKPLMIKKPLEVVWFLEGQPTKDKYGP